MAGMRQCGPPANTFLRCSTFGEKGSNSTPASRCLPRLCSIGEQSGERGLLRVANGATFIEITRAHVVAHPSPLHPREEREREFLSFVFGILFVFRGYPPGERFVATPQRTVVSTTVFASPTYFCARACFYFACSSECCFLSPLFSFSLNSSRNNSIARSPSRSFLIALFRL